MSRNPTLKEAAKKRGVLAWAAVGKKSGKVLRDWNGHYGIYAIRSYADADCPSYGKVRRVRIRVTKEAQR